MLQELADTVIEAEKSHTMLSTSWRNRKVSGIIQFDSEGLRTWGADGVTPGIQRPKNQEHQCLRIEGHPSSERENLPFLHLLGNARDWMMPATLVSADVFSIY